MLVLSGDERRALGGPREMSLNEKLGTVTTKQLVLKHSFTLPVDAKSSVVLTGQMLTREGVGAGNLFIKFLHRPSSKLSFEVSLVDCRRESHLTGRRDTDWYYCAPTSSHEFQIYLFPRL